MQTTQNYTLTQKINTAVVVLLIFGGVTAIPDSWLPGYEKPDLFLGITNHALFENKGDCIKFIFDEIDKIDKNFKSEFSGDDLVKKTKVQQSPHLLVEDTDLLFWALQHLDDLDDETVAILREKLKIKYPRIFEHKEKTAFEKKIEKNRSLTLEDVEMPVRVYKILSTIKRPDDSFGYKNIGEVADQYNENPKFFRQYRNFGSKSNVDLYNLLNKLGLIY